MNKQNFNISALNLAIFRQNLPSSEALLQFGGDWGETKAGAQFGYLRAGFLCVGDCLLEGYFYGCVACFYDVETCADG